jgi:large subunit ribosomal protein L21
MYAIIMTGGKQYRVEEGSSLVVEKLNEAEVGQEIVLDDVLMFSDGSKATVGKPKIEGVSVTAKVVAQKRAPKILVFKRKPKKGYNLEVAGRAAFICAPGATTWLSEKMGVSPIFFWSGRLMQKQKNASSAPELATDVRHRGAGCK